MSSFSIVYYRVGRKPLLNIGNFGNFVVGGTNSGLCLRKVIQGTGRSHHKDFWGPQRGIWPFIQLRLGPFFWTTIDFLYERGPSEWKSGPTPMERFNVPPSEMVDNYMRAFSGSRIRDHRISEKRGYNFICLAVLGENVEWYEYGRIKPNFVFYNILTKHIY